MEIDAIARKLQPLLPDKVARWRRTRDSAEPEIRALLDRHLAALAHKTLGDFRNKILLTLPPRQEAKGSLALGTVLYNGEKWPFGLSQSELLNHLAILGRSGAGKTNVAFLLIHQLLKRKIPFLFLDWKRTARHLLPEFGRRLSIYTPGRPISPFPFNPLVAPPGLETSVYLNLAIDVMGDAYTLGDGAKSLLRKAATQTAIDPLTPAALLENVDSLVATNRAHGWKVSAKRALETLVAANLGSSPLDQHDLVRTLLRRNTILELDALDYASKKFLIPILGLWLFYVQLATGTREKLALVVFVEEAHHVLHSHPRSRETVMEMLIRQCREVGIGFVIIDQHPSLISRAVLGNVYSSICLNLKDPTDITRAAALSLIQESERRYFSMLPLGRGVVKLQDRWRHPFLVQFPSVQINKGLVTDRFLTDALTARKKLSGLKLTYQATRQSNSRFLAADGFSDDSIDFILDVLRHRDDGVDARYRRLGWSTDRGNRIKNNLREAGFIDGDLLAVGRTRRLVLRVSSKATKTLGLDSSTVTRESIAHEFWKRWYARQWERKGYSVQLEAPRRHGRVDVLARNSHESVAIEIETGKSDVVQNVKQDLLTGFDRVVVVAANQNALHRIERDLGSAGLFLGGRLVLSVANSQ